MILPNELTDHVNNHLSNPEKMRPVTKLLVQVSKIGTSKKALKVLYFEKLLNFIRVLSLYIIYKNDFRYLITYKGLNGELSNNRMIRSLVDLLYQLRIIESKNGKTEFNKKYDKLISNHNELLINLFEQKEIQKKKVNKIFNDFLFVKDMIDKYSHTEYEFKYVKRNKNKWEQMIEEGTLNYEIRLAETLYELSQLRFPAKIKARFDEDYYTESGRNAFKNFTRYKFIDVFSRIVQKMEKINVLDIGCGYGNYIDVLSVNYPMFQITGIETQKNVYEEAREKFNQSKNVDLIHGNFFNYKFNTKYDIVLLNYVLFYFSAKEKSELLAKVKEILSEGGSIIVCQYFSNIESLKKQLALKQKEWTRFKEVEMFYSNKLLYANTLWNDTADTFSESVKWDEFTDIVAENGLVIKEMTNADKFYYSLFIELKVSE